MGKRKGHLLVSKKIEGEIEYTQDGVYMPDAEDEILICCSAPKTALVLDI